MIYFHLVKHLCITAIISLALFVYCSDASKKSPSKSSSSEINLQEELESPGNIVELPTSGSESIGGIVIDTDGDNVGDGLDLNGDNDVDMAYVSGALSVKTAYSVQLSVNNAPFGFFFPAASEKIMYYFTALGEEVGISKNADGSASIAKIIVDNGIIKGLDTSGDGIADDNTLDGLIAAFASGAGEFLSFDCVAGNWKSENIDSGSNYTSTSIYSFHSDGSYNFESSYIGGAGNSFMYEEGRWEIAGHLLSIILVKEGSSPDNLDVAKTSATAMPYESRFTKYAACKNKILGIYGYQKASDSNTSDITGVWVSIRKTEIRVSQNEPWTIQSSYVSKVEIQNNQAVYFDKNLTSAASYNVQTNSIEKTQPISSETYNYKTLAAGASASEYNLSDCSSHPASEPAPADPYLSCFSGRTIGVVGSMFIELPYDLFFKQ